MDEIDNDQGQRAAALAAASALFANGHDWVVGPAPTIGGAISQAIDDRYELAAFPFVEGDHAGHQPYESAEQRLAVLDCLVELHGASLPSGKQPEVDDLAIPARGGLFQVLDDPTSRWDSGPFAEPARQLVSRYTDALGAAFERCDELVATVQPDTFVVTHGEPHRGNVIFTADGVRVVDWDTARRAPRERDLWALLLEDPSLSDVYFERSGVRPHEQMIALFQLKWDLTDIALFVNDFRQPHTENANTQTAWNGLATHLDPTRWATLL